MLIEQQHFKRLREISSLSQRQLADYCKTTRFLINKAESMGNVKIGIINSISDFYISYFKAVVPYLPSAEQQELSRLIQLNKI